MPVWFPPLQENPPPQAEHGVGGEYHGNVMYENGKMRPVQTVLRRMLEGVNSTMILCKNFCKCHLVPSVQQLKKKVSYLGGGANIYLFFLFF
jgi:hypothetical protein